ncbi:hypothetical protein DITRI_Ditri03aG0017100 [Diplodiscus trichospermus]
MGNRRKKRKFKLRGEENNDKGKIKEMEMVDDKRNKLIEVLVKWWEGTNRVKGRSNGEGNQDKGYGG